MVDTFLGAGLTAIDNLFMKARRMFSALERPEGTSSCHNRVWNGYAPYNPAMLETYLTLFRTAHNFIHSGEDGRTPAMRMGFAQEPLRYEDILWADERVPRPKAEPRRGARGGGAGPSGPAHWVAFEASSKVRPQGQQHVSRRHQCRQA